MSSIEHYQDLSGLHVDRVRKPPREEEGGALGEVEEGVGEKAHPQPAMHASQPKVVLEEQPPTTPTPLGIG